MTDTTPIAPGDRLRVCSGPRLGTLALERGRDDVLATMKLRRDAIEIVAGDHRRELSATALGNALVVHEGDTYELRLPKRGRGELRRGSTVLAELEMRHPEHGSVLIIDVASEVPEHDAMLFGHAGTIAFGRGLAGRRKKREAATSWGKESALADVTTLVYLDMRTGGDAFSGVGWGDFGGGAGDGGGGGGGGDGGN